LWFRQQIKDNRDSSPDLLWFSYLKSQHETNTAWVYRIVGKYLFRSRKYRLDISFVIGMKSQFMQFPCVEIWDAIVRILRYIKNARSRVVARKPGNCQYCEIFRCKLGLLTLFTYCAFSLLITIQLFVLNKYWIANHHKI